MALSEKDVDLLLDTGSIVAKSQAGRELSPRDQEMLSTGSKLFIYLASNVDPITRYKDIANHVTGEGLDVFCKSVPPSTLEDTAKEVVRLIAEEKRQKRTKELREYLVDLLHQYYKKNPVFTWADITPGDRKDFEELADLEKIANEYQAYLEIREEAGLPPEGENKEGKGEEKGDVVAEKPEGVKEELVTNNNQVIAANLAMYLADKEALENQINTVFKDRLEKDRLLIRQMVEVMIAKKQAEILLSRADQQTNQVIQEIGVTDPKNPPLSAIDQTSQAIVEASIVQTGIPFTPSQVTAAAALFTTASVAGLVDLTNPTSISETAQFVLATNPNYHTPATDAFREIEKNFVQTPSANNINTSQTQVTPDLAVDLSQTHLSEVEIESEKAFFVFSAPLLDRVENMQKIAQDFSTGVLTNPQTEIVMAHLNGNITQQQEIELAKILIATNLVTRIAPTQAGAAVATVIEKLNPVNPFVDAATVRVVSMGLDIKSVDKHLSQKPTSKLAQFFRQNPNVLLRLRAGSQHLENPKFDLGQEIKSPALGNFGRRIQSFTNRVSGILPGKTSQIFNAITHPGQFIQSKIGNFIGNQLVGRFKSFLIEKAGAKIANESFKRAAQFVLKEGLQKGLEKVASFAIAKIGGTALVAGLSAALGVSTGGVSLVIQAAVMAAMWVGEKTLGLIKKMANGLAQAMTDEDFDGKAVFAAPLIALAGLGGVLGSLAAATAVAASSAAIIIMGSTFVGFLLYISVITVAPIITTIAHLESGISDTSRVGVIGGSPPALLPPGVLPDSCPNGPPVTGFGITQGPGVGSHTSGWGINIAGVAFVSQGQAIDYGTPMNTPVSATHDGQAYYYQEGDNQPNGYGNYVAIIGSCPNAATGQTIQFLTTYAHLNAGNINRGGPTAVTRGQMIGLTDNTGHSTGPHLHYEIFGLGDINRYVGP